MKVIVFGSAGETGDKKPRHSGGKNLFEIADYVVDSCCPLQDASVDLKHHQDKVGPLSTIAFITTVWMTICTVAEILEERGVKACTSIRRTMCPATLPRTSASMPASMSTKSVLWACNQ